VRQVNEGLVLGPESRRRASDRRQELERGLDGSFRPTTLLRFESRDQNRELCRANQIGAVDDAPAAKLRAIAQIEVLGQRVVRPASCVLDGDLAPDASRPVEVQKQVAPETR